MTAPNCSDLAVRRDFAEYARALLEATDWNLERLSPCREQVCIAMWGSENSDVSGIGMIIGYLLDHALGFLFAMAVSSTNPQKHPHLFEILQRGLAAFHDCASFLAFSVEVASSVLLVKVDFGISTNGMGNDTVHIIFAVAMLVLLPLTYAVWTLPTHQCERNLLVEHTGVKVDVSKPLMLFVVCWALAFYPFFSAMNAAFGPSMVSSRQNAALSIEQLDTIQTMCFRDVQPISQTEANLMASLIALTYIPLSLVLVSNIILSGIKSNHPDSGAHRRLESVRAHIPDQVKRYAMPFALVGMASLASGLFWTVFRARQAQEALSRSLGVEDEADNWTFGQVAAVTLFSPVFFECWDGFVSYRMKGGKIFEGPESGAEVPRGEARRSTETS